MFVPGKQWRMCLRVLKADDDVLLTEIQPAAAVPESVHTEGVKSRTHQSQRGSRVTSPLSICLLVPSGYSLGQISLGGI